MQNWVLAPSMNFRIRSQGKASLLSFKPSPRLHVREDLDGFEERLTFGVFLRDTMLVIFPPADLSPFAKICSSVQSAATSLPAAAMWPQQQLLEQRIRFWVLESRRHCKAMDERHRGSHPQLLHVRFELRVMFFKSEFILP